MVNLVGNLTYLDGTGSLQTGPNSFCTAFTGSSELTDRASDVVGNYLADYFKSTIIPQLV